TSVPLRCLPPTVLSKVKLARSPAANCRVPTSFHSSFGILTTASTDARRAFAPVRVRSIFRKSFSASPALWPSTGGATARTPSRLTTATRRIGHLPKGLVLPVCYPAAGGLGSHRRRSLGRGPFRSGHPAGRIGRRERARAFPEPGA